VFVAELQKSSDELTLSWSSCFAAFSTSTLSERPAVWASQMAKSSFDKSRDFRAVSNRSNAVRRFFASMRSSSRRA